METISYSPEQLALDLISCKKAMDVKDLTERMENYVKMSGSRALAEELAYLAVNNKTKMPPVRIGKSIFSSVDVAERIAKKLGPPFEIEFFRALFADRLKRHSLPYNDHNTGDYAYHLFNCFGATLPNTTLSTSQLRDLKLELSFHLYLDELLRFCEKDIVLGLFKKYRFEDLPGSPKEIEEVLTTSMKSLLVAFYSVVAKIIKGGRDLDKKEILDINTLAEHIIGVYTSLLQLYYMEKRHESRFDRLYIGGESVASRLKEIFKEHYSVEDTTQFRKWAFIALFHDIGKFEETLPSSTRKHDLASAEIIQKWGILDRLPGMLVEDKKEISIIIEKHVDIGCHGPADHAVTRIQEVFQDSNVCAYFTGPGGNIEYRPLRRFFANAILMWAHDAAGTTRRGVATTPPFVYIDNLFLQIIDQNNGIAVGKNVRIHSEEIRSAFIEMAQEKLMDRIGRIITAWAYDDNLKDYQSVENFEKCVSELIATGKLKKHDYDLFIENFHTVSCANHLLNMLVQPVRQGNGLEGTVKGLVLFSKASRLTNVDEIRAFNSSGAMELDGTQREAMAEQLIETINKAGDVKSKGASIWFVDNRGKKIPGSKVTMTKVVSKFEERPFLSVCISI